jgi:hypothetical protein
MCGCESPFFIPLVIYGVISLFVGTWHLSRRMDEYNYSMPTIKDVNSIGMIIYYLFSIPAKIITPIIMNTFKLTKLVLTCKFK